MIEIMNPAENNMQKEIEENISDFKAEEVALKEDINGDQSPEEKKVEKLGKNKVRFPYESNEHECSLLLEKKGDMIFVKLESLPTYMGSPMEDEFTPKNSDKAETKKRKEERKQYIHGKLIPASTSDIFLKELGKTLDVIIGKGRVSASDKAKQAYELLGFTNN